MRYHLIGDQGVSMSGIRIILESFGHQVSGSDLKTGGHKQENISADIDFVVRTSAVSPGSPGWIEVERANELGVTVLKRSELIKEITADKFLIAVSGMHGKTTVTSLIGLMLIEAGLDPTVLVGEKISEFNGQTARVGKSKYFVLEACEYDKSFFDFYPDICVITNLDVEHLDTYPGGMPEIKEAFKKFISNIKSNGKIVYCGEDSNLAEVIKGSSLDLSPYNKVTLSPELLNQLTIIGDHNILNATAAAVVARSLNISDDIIEKVFKSFKGAKRRLELWGEINGAKVYDDYGHHPTEIAATINALKSKFADKKLITIFWPHQYKRILPLRDEFVEVLSKSDEVILKPIFFVPGRDEVLDISSEFLVDKLIGRGVLAKVVDDNKDIVEDLKSRVDGNNIILTIGIPPIYEVAKQLVGSING